MRRILLMTFVLVLCAAAAQATTVGLDFNNNSFEVRGDYQLSQDQYGAAFVGGGFLLNNNKDSRLGTVGLRFAVTPDSLYGLTFAAGVAGMYGHTNLGNDLGAVAVGAHVDFVPPELYGVGFGGKFYYAPTIFSFADSDGLWLANIKTFYNVSPNLQVYLGYQKIHGKFDSGPDENLDGDLRIGLSASF